MKKALLILILPLLAFATVHKFYISVTNVKYSQKDKALQITCRVFTDDMNTVLLERYGIETALGAEEESPEGQEYLKKYVQSKFNISINGKPVAYTILGKKYDTDVIIMFLEVPNVDLPNITNIGIDNKILTDLFDEQQNVLHFNIAGKKKSFVLLKSDTKGMLNL